MPHIINIIQADWLLDIRSYGSAVECCSPLAAAATAATQIAIEQQPSDETNNGLNNRAAEKNNVITDANKRAARVMLRQLSGIRVV